TEIELLVDGPDEAEAMAALEALGADGFGERAGRGGAAPASRRGARAGPPRGAGGGARRVGRPAALDQGAAVARGGGAPRVHLRRAPADAGGLAARRAPPRAGAG